MLQTLPPHSSRCCSVNHSHTAFKVTPNIRVLWRWERTRYARNLKHRTSTLPSAAPSAAFSCPQYEAKTSLRLSPSPTVGRLFLPVFPASPALLQPHLIHSHLGAFCGTRPVCQYQHAGLPTGKLQEDSPCRT